MYTRALLPFLVDVLRDTDLCALNLPKGIGIARFRRRAAEARDVVSYPRPPPTGATCTRDIYFGREVNVAAGRLLLTGATSTRAGGRLAPISVTAVSTRGRGCLAVRVSDPTLPSGRHLRWRFKLRRATPSWAEPSRPGGARAGGWSRDDGRRRGRYYGR